MDDNFTTKADVMYLASITQEKKVVYLEAQLRNSELYNKTLEKSLQETKTAMTEIIKGRTNQQILSKFTENLYKLQKRVKQFYTELKQCNAKLLIEMQLRIQEKAQYFQKINQLENAIFDIKKANKDKQNEFTVVVNKLRKYQDIRECTLEDKISKDDKKQLQVSNRFKEELITRMAEDLKRYKEYHKNGRKEVDRKIEILLFAMENQSNYEGMKRVLLGEGEGEGDEEGNREILNEEGGKKRREELRGSQTGRMKITGKNVELIRQIKRLVINNRLLEQGFNQSIRKNQQLLINNQFLLQANLNLQERLKQYKSNRLTIQKPRKYNNPTHNNNSNSSSLSSMIDHRDIADRISIKDDSCLHIPQNNNFQQQRLKRYLKELKSQEYDINVEQLHHDVGKINKQSKPDFRKNKNHTHKDKDKDRIRSISAETHHNNGNGNVQMKKDSVIEKGKEENHEGTFSMKRQNEENLDEFDIQEI